MTVWEDFTESECAYDLADTTDTPVILVVTAEE